MVHSSRHSGRLPIVPAPESDELMSSWLRRVASAYATNLRTLLEQLGMTQTNPATFDWAAEARDLEVVAIALGTTRGDLMRRSFVGMPRAGLMFVSLHSAAKICPRCQAEFASRGLDKVVLHQWKIAVATHCGRCNRRLASTYSLQRQPLHDLRHSGYPDPPQQDVFHVVGMAMYDHLEAPIVERLFRAVATPICWPKSPGAAASPTFIADGPAIMWRLWNQERPAIDRAVPRHPIKRNFAAWPPFVQIVAADAVGKFALRSAVDWMELEKLGLLQTGDAEVARRLFSA